MTATTEKITTADHASNVVTVVHAFLGADNTEITDAGKTIIADAMRAVPAPSRGAVQSTALVTIMGMADVNVALIGDVLSVWSDLSTYASTATRAKVERDPNVVAAEKVFALRRTIAAILFDAEMDVEAVTNYTNDVDAEKVSKMVDAITATVEKTGATRTTFTDTIADIVTAEKLSAGTALVGRYGNAKATLTATGIKCNGKTYDNPSSAAASVVTGAVNGWAFWCVIVDGKKVPLSTYRSA